VTLAAALPIELCAKVGACRACDSMAYSHVLGAANGPADARVMFVGEAPGRFGAGRSGVPFQGDESGRRFESLLAVSGLTRDEVFVTNAILCNPLDASGRNRRPKTSEVQRCLAHLREQIEAVDPALVVALGEVALTTLARIEPHGLRLRDGVAQPTPWFNRSLVALNHPGRRALVHRSDELQRLDWAASLRSK
jgi:uracil-DNA glycosylase family 4